MHQSKGRRLLGVVLAAGMVAAGGGALAASAGQKAAEVREDNFKQLGGAFKTINDELKASTPDMAKIAAAAKKMNALAPQVPRWFPKGSGPETGGKTRAKAEIWTDAAGFAAVQRSFQAEVAKLDKVAAGGDLSALRDQVRAVGGTCKSCHEKYRGPKK